MTGAVASQDVPYMTLYQQLIRSNSTEEKRELLDEMEKELHVQTAIRDRLETIARKVYHGQESKNNVRRWTVGIPTSQCC